MALMAETNTSYIYLFSKSNETIVDSSFVRLNKMNSDAEFEPSFAPVAPIYTPLIDESTLLPLDFQVKEDESGFGIFGFYVLVVAIWSVLYRKNYKNIRIIGRSVFSNSALNQMLDGRGGLNSVVSLSTFIIGVSVISLINLAATLFTIL